MVASWTGGVNPLPFLIHDSGPKDPQRMLLFGADEGLTHFAASFVSHMDRKFQAMSTIFLQLYVIRVKVDDGTVSTV